MYQTYTRCIPLAMGHLVQGHLVPGTLGLRQMVFGTLGPQDFWSLGHLVLGIFGLLDTLSLGHLVPGHLILGTYETWYIVLYKMVNILHF